LICCLERREKPVKKREIEVTESVIAYMEDHLDEKLSLEAIAAAVHYSKYHIHRLFAETVGMTIHDYAGRRQLTEAAKLLVFSEKSILDIALLCGYESQQSFTSAFKSMYKLPPAAYRERQVYYPLQLRFSLKGGMAGGKITGSHIRLAERSDIPAWLELTRLVIDGYPYFDEREYASKLEAYIEKRQALILKEDHTAVGIMAFSYETGSIDFMGVHPQYRSCGIQKLFLDKLMEEYLPGREISTTTYREHDRADTGYRKELKRLGFGERELLVEFGYPTQKMVLTPEREEGMKYE